jgi:XTP/dITP diphosphohydrolase
MRPIVVATGNPGKLREIRQVLAELPVEVAGLDELGNIPEPEETGETFADNARDKALYYARQTGMWCLADDSGLVVDALDGRPGVRSARYAADELPPHSPRDAVDRANNDRLLDELRGVPDERRTARFVCHLALAGDGELLLETTGTIEGRIGFAPAGENGFGYDPLFVVPDLGCTTAQLPPEHKNTLSHRGQAVRHFARLLRERLGL